MGLYYSEFIYGVPPVMVEHMASFPIVHQVNIFVTNRFCPCPRVLKHERLLIEQLGIRGFYHCICRSPSTPISFHSCLHCPTLQHLPSCLDRPPFYLGSVIPIGAQCLTARLWA